jgi:hypothetical protein
MKNPIEKLVKKIAKALVDALASLAPSQNNNNDNDNNNNDNNNVQGAVQCKKFILKPGAMANPEINELFKISKNPQPISDADVEILKKYRIEVAMYENNNPNHEDNDSSDDSFKKKESKKHKK